jgi:Ras-related GTP-binding protein C/D
LCCKSTCIIFESSRAITFNQNSQSPKAFLFDIDSRLYIATDASPVDSATHNLCCEYLQMLNSFGPLYRLVAAHSINVLRHNSLPRSATRAHSRHDKTCGTTAPLSVPTADVMACNNTDAGHASSKPHKNLFYPSAATSLHPSTPGTTLTYHLITPQLALLAILPTNVHESRRGLLEYNVVFFREGVQEICDAARESRAVG